MSTEIRDYQPEDRTACLDLFDGNMPRYFAPSEREEFDQFLTTLDQSATPYQVLLHEGEVVGCGGISCDPATRSALMIWGMVSQDLHGQGLGTKLAEARLARARTDPAIDEVRLATSQHVTGFYERFGFATTAVTPDGFGPGIDRVDMVLKL